MSQITSGKFRISLSLSQIDWIIAKCQQDMPELHKQLSLLKAKADLGYTKPSYEIKPVTPKTKKDLPLEVVYKMATKFLTAGESIPEHLLAGYTEYRYLNDLMDDVEIAAYEETTGF